MQLETLLENIPENDTISLRNANKLLFEAMGCTCVIIDDDPTGNQTVYDIPLLTTWDQATLEHEFLQKTPAFFLLTNSRSLTTATVAKIYQTIGQNIAAVAEKTGRNFVIISRSDSTLRGHFQTELTALKASSLYKNEAPIQIFIPVMFEGGRVTINNTHYIQDASNLIPVNESPFAKDTVFGYQHADLKAWILEKTANSVSETAIFNFSLKEIRTSPIAVLVEKLLNSKKGNYLIFDAINYQDLDKITHALLTAQQKGATFLYRTSSSFVPSYLGISPKKLVESTDILTPKNTNGGLVIVGSYVPKSSSQLQYLLDRTAAENHVELEVTNIFEDKQGDYLASISKKINIKISSGQTVILYTSRKLLTGTTAEENLAIGNMVSNALITLVQSLEHPPKFLLAKGGITSHDIAIKGLGMRRSTVIGQLLPGVPLWKMSDKTKFPDLAYIVFPGNVGNESAVYDAINKLTTTTQNEHIKSLALKKNE